jgi:Transposase IS66 family/RNase_H superfamily
MAAKDWVAGITSVLGLIVAGGGLYLANIREVDDLRVVYGAAPLITVDDSGRRLDAKLDQVLTVINSGTRSATIVKISTFISQPYASNESCEHSWDGDPYVLKAEPFEIKSHESRAVTLQGMMSTPISSANRGKRSFIVEACFTFDLVVPDAGMIFVKKSLHRGELHIGAMSIDITRSKVTPQRVSPPVKYDNKLKAIAIKKSQVHVIGTPEFGGEGTPVFIDVEGMPDRDLYYLIGLLYQDQGRAVNRSFWANRPEDEFKIWQNCVRALREIDNPRLVHYGAYESRFLKAMRARWASTDEDTAFIDQLISGSTNLVSMIYGKLYFPTYSNSLKEIARWLGFEWTWPQASGSAAIVLRRLWELTAGDHLRRELVNYNIEDCRATELVADAIKRICRNDEQAEPTFQTVNISSLEVGFQRTFGKFAGALPEFEKINAAAYWDYQRSKVYVRTDKTVRQSLRKSAKLCTRVAVEKEVIVDDRPKVCPRCGASKIWIAVRMANVNFDLRFTRRGIKRWAVRYRYNNYRCGACKAQMTPYVSESKYGQNIRAYIAYLLLELRLSHRKLREHIATVFGVTVLNTMVNDIKQAMAKKYEPTYHVILKQIVTGPVVHADETKGVVYGGGHYVWVFANLNSVAYVYSASREASKLNEVLSGFKGVLVSDFYTAYDSLPCPQQKCLIHLMRDINEDLLKHPFNEELTFVAQQFGTVLRGIVETIDRHGLKKFYLQKHKGSAQQFLSEVASLDCSTEVGSALKKRIDKNKDKLFTFLDHDGVPWNNNNAEHAVRAFTRLRNGMATSTPKGTTDYCILLSLQQTLRYRGIEFLEFLRSGRTDM